METFSAIIKHEFATFQPNPIIFEVCSLPQSFQTQTHRHSQILAQLKLFLCFLQKEEQNRQKVKQKYE